MLVYGEKHGAAPEGLDVDVDCREIPNVNRASDMRHKSGLDDEVRDLIEGSAAYRSTLRRVLRETRALLDSGHDNVDVGIHCYAGRHRSVVVALAAARELLREVDVVEVHLRDRRRWA